MTNVISGDCICNAAGPADWRMRRNPHRKGASAREFRARNALICVSLIITEGFQEGVYISGLYDLFHTQVSVAVQYFLYGDVNCVDSFIIAIESVL